MRRLSIFIFSPEVLDLFRSDDIFAVGFLAYIGGKKILPSQPLLGNDLSLLSKIRHDEAMRF